MEQWQSCLATSWARLGLVGGWAHQGDYDSDDESEHGEEEGEAPAFSEAYMMQMLAVLLVLHVTSSLCCGSDAPLSNWALCIRSMIQFEFAA